MKKIIITIITVLACALCMFAQNKVTVNSSELKGEIRPLNGVGGGPKGVVSPSLFKAAGIPFTRLSDIGYSLEFGFELFNIFPDFDADENKASSYDFTITDEYIKNLVGTGSKIIWRLGNWSNESWQREKYGSWPPKDFKKWARICEHVIRHYNEGWADGYHFNIEYWEIWNEPDLDQRILPETENVAPKDVDKLGKVMRYEVAPHMWGGTMEQYYEFATTVYKHLQRRFPKLKIGGPGNADFEYNEPFIQAMKKAGIKPGFFSWHRYSRNPETFVEEGKKVRELLDRYGWSDVPTFLDEWNYVSSWDNDGYNYSWKVRSSVKGAAFTVASMCLMQEAGCTDVMTYYDWRHNTSYNGAFDRESGCELAGYHAIRNWSKLSEYGTEVAVDCPEADLYATAAKNADGKVRLLLARYNDDDSVYESKRVSFVLPEGCTKATCVLSDSYHINTQYPIIVSNGEFKVSMEPNSFVIVNFE